MIRIAPSTLRVPQRVGRLLIVLTGLVAIVVSVYLFELHGQGTCDIPRQQCAQKYNAQPWATLVLATGVAALVAVLGLYLRDRVSALARRRNTRAV